MITITDAIIMAVASFMKVFSHGFQSRNIAHNHYKAAFLTSWLIGLSEIAFLSGIVKYGWHSFFPLVIGGSLGVVASMATHNYLFRRK